MRSACKRFINFLLTLLILSGAMLSLPHNVRAGAYIVVTTKTDEYKSNGNCSLREAIIATNENRPVDKCPAGSATSMDTIYLPAQTYFLVIGGPLEDASRTGDLDILGSVSIFGAGIGDRGTKVDAVNLGDRVFHVKKAGEVYISGMEIKNGFVPGTTAQGRGGGVFNVGSKVHISNVLFFGNQSSNTGGNVDNDSGSVMYITRTTVSKGSAKHGAGIYNLGLLVINQSLLVDNLANESGGAIDNNTSDATLILTNSTLAQNNATSFSGTAGGAGIFNDGKIQITNSTIARNTGIGMVLAASSTGFVVNTILAGNTRGNCDPLVTNPSLVDGGFNLRDTKDCKFLVRATNKTVAGWAAVKMSDTLANNSGPTQTFALLAGSPAIDGGRTDGKLIIDQRYHIRPWVGIAGGKALVDIGAYEYGAPAGGLYLPFIRK